MQSRISTTESLPPGLKLFSTLFPPQKTLNFYKIFIFFLTFFAYASFHASRKPPSIVKSILNPDHEELPLEHRHFNSSGWPPFDSSVGTRRLGELDLAFLSAYSIGMYFSGHAADRINIRYFLLIGMVGSGAMTMEFGLGYWMNVHSFIFFVAVQIPCGLFQSIGWPCVITVLGNWFGKSRRGLIMGVWSSNTSIGNVLGSITASAVIEFGWGWSFVIPSVFILVVAVLVFMFLVVRPEDVGLGSGEEIGVEMKGSSVGNLDNLDTEEVELLHRNNLDTYSETAIGFFEAWNLPGVIPFSFCLFFSKLVAYTFMYWLPFYIRHTAVGGVHLSEKKAGILSSVFDVGGVFGGILAGYLSDAIEARAVTSIIFLSLSMPSLVAYHIYGSISMATNTTLMFLSGLLVNGPFSLIATAVAADLATPAGGKGSSRALATVTAIIDGTGSVGAALGPLLAGYISVVGGWDSVFLMLNLSLFMAALFLLPTAKSELSATLSRPKWLWSPRPSPT